MSIGNIVNSVLGTGGDGGASQLQQAALAEFAKIQFPSIEEQRLYLENLIQQGLVTPEQAKTFQQNPTAFRDMAVDTTGRNAQVSALKQLQTIANEGGMTAIDKARTADINEEIGTANRGAQEAIVQNAAERGVAGSGVELAARLNAQQGAATRGAAAGTSAAADAQTRALQALQSSAGIGANVYGADAELAARKAAAEDAINKFNTGNAQAVEMSNVESRNAAEGANLAEKQRVADTNAATRNSAQVANKGLIQTDFQNRLAKASGMAGQYNAIADTKLDQERRKDAVTGEVVGAGGQILAGYKKKGGAV